MTREMQEVWDRTLAGQQEQLARALTPVAKWAAENVLVSIDEAARIMVRALQVGR